VPQNLTVVHDDVLLAGIDFFTVQADEGSTIALTVGDQILGIAEGTGEPMDITITPQQPPTYVTLTVTKTNYYRYSAQLQVIPPNGPYIVKESHSFNDQNGNNQIDYNEEIMLSVGMKNVGTENAQDVLVNISTTDPFVTIIDGSENYGIIEPQGTITVDNAFTIAVSNDVPDDYDFVIDVEASTGGDTWNSSLTLTAFAPVVDYLEYSVFDPNGNNNGKLDPGETAEIVVTVGNIGSSGIYGVEGTLNCQDEYITVNNNNMVYGDIEPDESAMQNFSVTVSPLAPVGHEATFGFNISSASGHTGNGSFSAIIGQIPVLIIDLDGNNNSGSRIRTSLLDHEITFDYETTFPEETDLALYNTIFVCLGVYNVGGNHILTQSEGTYLADYLESGGNLYMEGGDTWYYDQKTDVHPYFKINGINDGGSDLGTLTGMPGSFTDGMYYTFAGDNNYIDRMEAVSPGFEIFKNSSVSPTYICAIAHDGGTYKTIGSSFEFGGLEDGDFTKSQLMEKYLEFFGFTGEPIAPGMPSGQQDVCNTDLQVEYVINAVENTDYYIWMIEPSDAGTPMGSDTCTYVNWNPEFSGVAQIKVCGMNSSGAGPFSQGCDVVVRPAPTAILASGSENVCTGGEVELDVILTGDGPWTVEMNDGSIHNVTSANWHPVMTIDETTQFSIVSVDDAHCSNTGEGMFTAYALPNPTFSIGNDTSICFYHTITITAPTGYASYNWYNGSTATSVVVDSTGAGMSGSKDVWVTVTDENGCLGTSHVLVTMDECAGINENLLENLIGIYPNPAGEVINIKPLKDIQGATIISLVDAYGKLVYSVEYTNLTNSNVKTLNINNLQNGVYFLIFENSGMYLNTKIVVEK